MLATFEGGNVWSVLGAALSVHQVKISAVCVSSFICPPGGARSSMKEVTHQRLQDHAYNSRLRKKSTRIYYF